MNELILQTPDGALDHWGRPGSGLPPLRYAVGVLHSRWRLAAIVAALVFAAVAGLAMLMPHNYYAQVLLIIHSIDDNPAEPANEQAALPPDTSAIDTEVEVLRSPALAEAVVRNLKLYKDPEFGSAPGSALTDATMRTAAAAVEARSSIRRIGLTYAVQVGFSARSMDMAKRVANGLVQAYLARKLQEKLTAVTQANHDLNATLGNLRQQALDAEARVERYKAQNNLLGSDATASTETELATLDQQVSEARADAASKQARVAAALAAAQSNSVDGTEFGTNFGSNTIGVLRQKEADVSASLSQLETEFRSDYPPVKKTEAELQNIRAEIQAETHRIVSSLRADARAAREKEDSLVASRASTQQRLAANTRARVGLLTLQQAADTTQKIYQTYLTRASKVAVARSLQRVDATVESKAIVTGGSILANPRVVYGLALVLALLAGLGAILISESWSRKIRSGSDVARDMRLPLAGVLPDIGALSRAIDPASNIANQSMTAFAESLRSLRAFLVLSVPAGRSKIIAVTSAVPGEGKTLVSACLARTLASAGSNVALLDCDPRNASASKFFEKPEFGLADVVNRSVPLERALIFDSKSGVWFLRSSTTDCKLGEQFGIDRIDGVLRALSERFDHVIIDTSPLLGFADARILASKADSVLFVVRWNDTSAPTVHAATEILRVSGAHVAGAVLNKVDVKQQARFGFADGSDYYHHYGSAYAQTL
ncbi:MAG TPA: AAA family ATPase [Rhizomicrobium sp.]|nr:AAA family ATPase [Rhizomicrobium sp.]